MERVKATYRAAAWFMTGAAVLLTVWAVTNGWVTGAIIAGVVSIAVGIAQAISLPRY